MERFLKNSVNWANSRGKDAFSRYGVSHNGDLVDKRGFSRYGVLYFYVFVVFEYVRVRGV